MTQTRQATAADRPVGRAADGVLVIDKPAGCTSHDVVARVRRLAGTRKVGHAGTLDPLATGVLLVGIGRATRLLGHLALRDKAYAATIRLGETTVTDDAEGDVLAEVDASHLDDDTIRSALQRLTGDLQQIPAAVSAVKVDGKRSYARVRGGESVALTPRAVQVSVFELLEVRRLGPRIDLDVRVECSPGTYVRALARDLGRELLVGGHLQALRRSRVGCYSDDVAHVLDELTGLAPAELPVLPLDEVACTNFPAYRLSPELEPAVRNGRRIDADLGSSRGPVAVMSEGGEFVALYEQDGHQARAVAVFAPA